ncbi:MAG: SDR family NAD(P)-dependent oxidoreductase [bacterium]|nr:SDR family NAD(P)-dependent oxidoreductase [bacterium]
MEIKTPKIKSKNILVTGGAGFIGSHLADRLVREGGRVVVVDNLSSGRKENISPQVKFYQADVRDQKIAQILQKEQIQIVFHLAAYPIVETAYENPFDCLEVNIMGTVNVLEQCRLKGDLEAVIVASSDKAYGKAKDLPYKEQTPLLGDHPYEVSKTAADLIAKTYFKTYGLPVVITRFGNVFGPRDVYFNRIIPGIFESVGKNKDLLIRSDGRMIRQYLYVDDVVEGYLKIAEKIDEVRGEEFNFGSENIFSVFEVINRVENILNRKINFKVLNVAKNEIQEQRLDWSKAKTILAWQPKTSFDEAIKKTSDWYKNI